MSDLTADRAGAYANPPVTRHSDIACRGVSPEIFYPETGKPADAARAICARCPHRDECLRWALETGQRFGVWGGTTAKERQTMRREAA